MNSLMIAVSHGEQTACRPRCTSRSCRKCELRAVGGRRRSRHPHREVDRRPASSAAFGKKFIERDQPAEAGTSIVQPKVTCEVAPTSKRTERTARKPVVEGFAPGQTAAS